MAKRGRKSTPLEDRFWVKVLKGGPDECWPWQGQTHDGYGIIFDNGKPRKRYLAHRLAVLFARGEEGPLYRHTCHNRACCNPLHLVAGTKAQNNKDRWDAGRGARGEDHPGAKIAKEQVRSIRADTRLQKIIAEEHGITQGHVSNIVRRRVWTHI